MSLGGVLLAALALLVAAAVAFWAGVRTGYAAGVDETRRQLWDAQRRGPRARSVDDDLVPSHDAAKLPFVPFKGGI